MIRQSRVNTMSKMGSSDYSVTPHAVEVTGCGPQALVRPPGISDRFWFHLADGLAEILNRANASIVRTANE